MTQKERILSLLDSGRAVSNHELRNMSPPIYQYPVRIKELREAGYDIRTERDLNNPKTFYYRLIKHHVEENGQLMFA